MKCLLIWIFLFNVSWINTEEKLLNSTYLQDLLDKHDIWVWGYSDPKVDNRKSENIVSTTTEAEKTVTINTPCDPFVYTEPTYSGRISEMKCQEYIWQQTNKAEKEVRERRCQMWRAENGDIDLVVQVVNGHATYPGEFPHMGAIGWKSIQNTWEFKCGSTVISPRFVITAAHCSSASPGDTTLQDPIPKIIRFMTINLENPDSHIDVEISKIIVHPDYKPPKKSFDIALMELNRELEFNQLVMPACLWTQSQLNSTSVATITGWGTTREKSLKNSERLLAANLDLIDSDQCNELLSRECNRHWCGINDHQLCAGKLEGGTDACQGDSGGPLQIKIPLPETTSFELYYVIGVTSFGIGCARAGLPGVYTRVSSFLDWIEPIVWK